MKMHYRIIIILFVAVSSFLVGAWVTHYGSGQKATAERKILYYVDPMNPAFKSDKPGIAPCGMALEPVYSDSVSAGNGPNPLASMPPGTIRISPEKQQLIGVRLATVEKTSWSHNLRVLGKVASDETRVYRINAAVNGWIVDALPVTTGSLVKKNQLLATFYSLEYRSFLQSYFNVIGAGKSNTSLNKPEEQTTRYSAAQLKQIRDTIRNLGQGSENAQADYYKKNLFNYGMSEYQLEEMERTRKVPDVMEIRAPIPGFVLSRNVSPDLRFDRGVEFFRIADLSRVWILADVFENEASYFKPGMQVKIELPYQKKTLTARMSHVLPQFDPATRTLKVRLEADNPGYVMRPDMFVNVELPVSGPAAVIVPADAVVDSGLKKTVFVDRGSGYFEPRQVETGGSFGERIEITRGLMPGEKIVVSGNFLIDSETRMQQATAGIAGKPGRDLVCGMNIDEDRSKAVGYLKDYKGNAYFFCSPECRDEFAKTPERYASAGTAAAAKMPAVKKGGTTDDHTAHKAMKGTAPRAATARSHDHKNMTSAMPKGSGQSSPSPGMSPKPGDKAGAMLGPSTSQAPMMPGPQGPASMPAQMPRAMLPPPSGNQAPMMPRLDAGTPGSGSPSPVPAGQGTGAAIPGSQAAGTISESKTERAGRLTSRPPRRGRAGAADDAAMQAPQGGSSMTLPSNKVIISPGTVPGKGEQQMKAPGGSQGHD